MPSVFLLQHIHILGSGEESIKVIGIYTTLARAKEAIERLGKQPGFSDFPKLIDPRYDDIEQGFHLDEYELDSDHWSEGYVTQ